MFDVSCRSVGPGGTSVTFYASPKGLKAVWTNENCPYDFGDSVVDPHTQESSNGHNVDWVPWSLVMAAAQAGQSWERYQPSPRATALRPVEDDWTQEEQDAVLSIALEASDPDAVLEVGNHIVSAMRMMAGRK